jgi:hypothetical protein
MSKKRSERLDVQKVMEDFQREEESSPRRKDAFKIDKPFEEALDTILNSKPTGKKTKA